ATATDKQTHARAKGVSSPEAAALDRELAAEKAAEEAKNPHVMPGLQLPEDSGGVLLLDTYKTQPQLVELQQNGGQVNKNTKSNMLKAAIIPIASAKQTIELAGPHRSGPPPHALPSIYRNVMQA